MKKTHLSQEAARRLILNAQLLDGETNLPPGKEGIVRTIDQLGYVQIDTIAAINRSHHHTLWTRRNDYHETMLHELQAKDRAVFEYWGHAMSYLPMSDYRYFLPRMRNFENPTSKWAQHVMQKNRHLLAPVLERVRNEGPLSAKDFAHASDKKGGTWWDWKPAKIALELLFWKGDLMICERRNFQKVYDLTERVLPEHIDRTIPSNAEMGQFFVRRALQALGVVDEKEILKFMQPGSIRDADLQVTGREVIVKTLRDLKDVNEVLPLTVEGIQGSTYYALTKNIENSDKRKPGSKHVFLLSPFDNLIIQRQRVKQYFGFDYVLECYLPAAKRTFGYFVLPILWGDQFVGRLDPKAERKTKTLLIHSLFLEQADIDFDEFLPLLAARLRDFAGFNGCEKIVIKKIEPEKMGRELRRLLNICLSK